MSGAPNAKFTIALSFNNKAGKASSVTFELDEKVAFAAAMRFKKELTHDVNIFEPVQNALAKLEGENGR